MIKKIHFKFQLLWYYFKKNIPFFILGGILGSLFFIYKSQVIAFINSSTTTRQVIGIQGRYPLSQLPEDIQNKISYGLTVINENDKTDISPIVDSVDTQNDNRTYVFKLKEDLFWHNGKKFTARDINIDIAGVKTQAISTYQIQISLDKPFSPIMTALAKPILLGNNVGLGPYKIQRELLQDGYLKELDLKPISDGNLPSINYKFYPNDSDLVTAFKLGEVDEINTDTLASDLPKSEKIIINPHIETDKRYLALFINTNKFPLKQARQALAYDTPKPSDRNERCLSPISPNSWAYNPAVKEYLYNPKKAVELMEKNKIETINLVVADRNLLPTAQEIKTSWEKDLGIKTTVTSGNQIDTDNYDVVLAYGSIVHDPDQYIFWHSTQQKTNITKLNHPRIDSLLEEGRQVYDPIERKRIYQDFQRYLLEESPVIFLSYPTVYNISRSK